MQEPISLDDAELEAKEAATEDEFLRLQKQGKLVSVITTTIVHLVIVLVLWCIIVALGPDEVPQIVAIAETKDDTYQIEKQDFARSVKRKPQPPKSASRVQTITSVATSPVSVPSIEDPVIDPLGIGTDFGRGFGQGKGNGDGGGGTSSFFGGTAKGNRVVFVVDFSGSMIKEGGGVRLQMLKKELISSISKLPKGMSFQVIYYSTAPWLGGESLYTAPSRFPDKPEDRIPWSEATKEGIARAVNHIKAAKPEGATLWKEPLELAFAMRPVPAVVWLLSDGEAQDAEEVVEKIKAINSSRIPINTIGLEVPGAAFSYLVDIARQTGGKASIVHKGKLYSGPAALRFADEFDPAGGL
ncbi:MAG: VWA domain-containing protein [Verrucomicrobiota bacterium]|nr:VWA domain-containing protein [Verrucomicrobiota bacterium]